MRLSRNSICYLSLIFISYFSFQNTCYAIGSESVSDASNSENYIVDPVSWYSFQSGDWKDPTSWTLDPEGRIFNNAGRGTPTLFDNVTITSGTTISLSTNRAVANRLEVYGTLDVAATKDHNFAVIAGNGLIRLSIHARQDNFPSGNAQSFISAPNGGTVEYYGSGDVQLNRSRDFYHLHINLSDNLDRITIKSAEQGTIINGDLTITSGTLRMMSSMRVRGDVQLQSGNILLQTPNNSQKENEMAIEGDFNISGGHYANNNRGKLDIYGDFSMTSGSFDVGKNGLFNLQGHLNVANGNFIMEEEATLTLTGRGEAQVLSGEFTGANRINQLIIDNPLGIEKVNGDIELIKGLQLEDGILKLDEDCHLLLDNSLNLDFSSGDITSSFVDGRLHGLVKAAGSSMTFPAGDSALFRPVTISNVSEANLTWSVEYFHDKATDHPQISSFECSDPGIVRVSKEEFWVISDAAGNSPPEDVSAIVQLSWGRGSFISSDPMEREKLRVLVWNYETEQWDNLGGTNFGIEHTESFGTLSAGIRASFSEKIFTLGSVAKTNVLPVDLISFSGSVDKKKSILRWSTSAEVDNDHFELQRSSNGTDYKPIAVVKGNRYTSEIKQYHFMDFEPSIGKNYYQLKQVDTNGAYEIYEKKVVVDVQDDVSPIHFFSFPNPATTRDVKLRVDADGNNPVTLVIHDLMGKKVYEEIISASIYNNHLIDLREVLKAGEYIATVSQYTHELRKKIIILD